MFFRGNRLFAAFILQVPQKFLCEDLGKTFLVPLEKFEIVTFSFFFHNSTFKNSNVMGHISYCVIRFVFGFLCIPVVNVTFS